MLYAAKIASRYLTASLAQTGLLVLGVALGVFIFIFMSALIGGLASFILARTAGDMAHVTIQAEAQDPALLGPAQGVLLAQGPATGHTAILRDTAALLPLIAALPGVTGVSPQINGSGFMTRGGEVIQVSIMGLEPGRESVIANLASYILQGSADLASGGVLLGKTLAEDLDVTLGQQVRLTSTQGVEALLTVTGIYQMGSGGPDRRQAYVGLATARVLIQMPQGVTRVEIKLTDLYAADALAPQIKALTGLDAKSWTEQAAQLLDALQAQAQTGYILKAFALLTIIIGVASALLLSTYRRRPEIGIMRAMGAGRGFVMAVFVIQGGLIGVMGGLLGAGLGYLVLLAFPGRESFSSGSGLPIDITQGAYGLAIWLTTLGAVLASILPARSAARLDPVTAIGQ
ncbi:ABC transporter permease [Rhodobacter sp. KR11]|uniref:ABC transporter permease n=1 Tax=Rhodobacter sp. KR11 TaxID=2974588 RepID=UPI002221A78A|nr:ABC transporter permease [Rhodobacter sp. KR11]MCW1919956.1 ABC transporter permease [Rhodobacter sp. KR11]